MSRKHFNSIAQALANIRPIGASSLRVDWLRSVKAIADQCQSLNSRFDRSKFIIACETLSPVTAGWLVEAA